MSTIGIDSAVDSDIAQQLQQGFDALNRGQLEVAAQACQTVLAKQPELAPAHFLVGLIALFDIDRSRMKPLNCGEARGTSSMGPTPDTEGRIARAESALKEVRRIQPTYGISVVPNQLGPHRQGVFCAGQ